MNGLTSYILSKKYVESTADSLGSLKGAPCTIKSQTETDDSYIVTFEWTGTSGTTETSQLIIKKPKDGIDGLPGKDGKDGQPGTDGTDGIGISKIEKIGTVDLVDTYRITFTDNSTFDYEVTNGKDGQGGTGGGEENTIESISVNGTPISIDENKNVDITVPSIDGLAKTEDIPTKVSELTNDSGYLTEHQDISGKVDKVEGKSLIADTEIARLATVDNYDDTDIRAEIANKADTTAIPSKVSELTNDSNYQTAEQVNSTVTTEIAKVVADAPESLNTLKEMSDWIAGHENDASAMNSAISDNKTAITALQTDKADKSEIPTTVAELTDSADYAKTADVNASIKTLQTDKADASDLTAHTNDTDIHVTAENKATWNTVSDKVDKEDGKGLSANDYTNEEKALVGTIEDKINKTSIVTALDDTVTDEQVASALLAKTELDKISTAQQEEFDKVNSNLSQLEFDKLSGGKNLWSIGDITVNGGDKKVIFDASFEENTQYTFSFTTKAFSNKDIGHFRMIYTDGTNTLVSFAETVGSSKNATSSSGKTLDHIDWYGWSDGETASFEKIQLEKGTTATDYEPYIPSVKMLAEENAQQNTEAMDLKMLGWTVPKECPIQNEVSGNQFIQKVGRVDLGSLDWTYLENDLRFYATITEREPIYENNTDIYCSKYATVIISSDNADKTICSAYYKTPSDIGVRDLSYTDATAFKSANNGVYVYYELATPITKTIDGNEAVEELNESLSVIGKCKNLLNPTLQTTTQNGVTCTANRDGTYTLNGTASSDVVLELESYKSYTGKEKFRLVGCPNGGSESKYYLAFRPNNAEENRKDIGSGVTFNDLSTSNKYAVAIIVLNGTTVTNLTFKPMLVNLDEHPELSNITYDDFVPYTGDGDTLTHDVAEIKNDLGGLTFSASGTTLSITDGTHTWTLEANS